MGESKASETALEVDEEAMRYEYREESVMDMGVGEVRKVISTTYHNKSMVNIVRRILAQRTDVIMAQRSGQQGGDEGGGEDDQVDPATDDAARGVGDRQYDDCGEVVGIEDDGHEQRYGLRDRLRNAQMLMLRLRQRG